MISRARLLVSLLLSAALFVSSCGSPSAERAADSAASPTAAGPTIVFMTDFGTANDAVAICRAVIYGIVPHARVTDITHQVTPFSIEEASRFLAGVSPYYPAGTVFLAVIDPGVGTSRKAVIVKSKKGQYFVVPDNGLVTPVIDRDGFDSAREITNSAWMLQSAVSSTFHGRDKVTELVQLKVKTASITDKGIDGDIIGLDDPFGSLITDIPGDEFKKLSYNLGDRVTLQINKKPVTVPYVKTFMDVPVGDSLLYIDSRGRVGIAVNQGNYSKKFNIEPPTSIFIPKKGASSKGK